MNPSRSPESHLSSLIMTPLAQSPSGSRSRTDVGKGPTAMVGQRDLYLKLEPGSPFSPVIPHGSAVQSRTPSPSRPIADAAEGRRELGVARPRGGRTKAQRQALSPPPAEGAAPPAGAGPPPCAPAALSQTMINHWGSAGPDTGIMAAGEQGLGGGGGGDRVGVLKRSI
ncbi:hypothetical protein SKAU_G00144640 [Synaphobranchus kaupii]|uniref:Uncharacterized protein n=1 Tax=Synaphobranchus kaupii TaxID=118154 RepID=A0A9Q1FU15_SYNKA|nr:hypothetical protein SKAU_G00144640 [Synaphobranchus kaupii]